LLSITAGPYVNFGDLLNQSRYGLLEAVRSALPEKDSELLLVIDQFEELFSLVGDEEERRHFLESLFSAVTDPENHLRVLITLRADFYDRPLMYPDFSRLVEERTVVVLPLSPEELEAVVRKPAERVGAILEQGLVAAITSDVADQPGALPLLQYALTELFERRDGRMLTCEAYQSIGGVLGALGRRAEEVYASLGNEGKVVARQLFLRLVTLGEGAEDTRRRVLQAELEALTSHSPLPHVGEGMGVREVLDSFGKARLLTFDHDPDTREPTIEVAHEALLQEWRRLGSWLDNSRADIRMQRVLANAALEWQRMDCDPGYLLRDSRLDQFEAWAATTDIALTQLEGDYLDASLSERRTREAEEEQRLAREAAMERRSRNFLRGLVGVFALATVVAVALSVYALSARNQAQSEADARATQQVIAQSEMSQRATAEAREIEQREEALNQASARATAEYKNLLRQEQDERQISVELAIRALDELKGPNPELAALLALETLAIYPYTPQAELALYKVVEDAGAHMIPRVGSPALTSAYWAPSGETIASSLDDQYLLIQEIETGEEVSRIATELGCNFVQEWSPSGDRLPAFGEDCAPVIYDVESGRPITTLESQSDQSFTSAYWSPDGKSIVTGGDHPIAQIWDATTGGKMLDLVGHDHFIEEVAWSPTGTQIATASFDSLIKIWDAATGVEERSLSGHMSIVNAVSWSPDGERIVSGGADNAVIVWDTHMGRILFRLRGHKDGGIDVAWSPDGRFIASLSWDHSVRVWDAESGMEIFRFDTYTFRDPNSISWSPEGDQLLIGGQYHHRIWDLSELSPLMTGHADTLLDAQWSPDGRLAATASMDNTLRVWDSKSGEHLQTLNLQEVPGSFAWSPDSEEIVAATTDGTIQIWDMSSGEISNEIASRSDPSFYSLSWSPDGSRIAALRSPEGKIVMWEAGTAGEINFNQSSADCPLEHLSWSPGGDRLLTYCQGDNSIQIWDASTEEILIRIEAATDNLDVIVWSPDGGYIAAGYEDGTIKIWNLDGGKASQAYSLPSTGYGILDLSWSPNSMRLASAEEGGMVRIWDLSSNGEVANYPVQGSATTVDWSPDGVQVIATSSEGTIPIVRRVWGSTADLVDYAKQCCAPRTLTPEERTRFELPEQ
jgi:WD40 repeat protein